MHPLELPEPLPVSSAPRKRPWLALATLLVTLAVSARIAAPPKAVPATAPAPAFSAERAMKHVAEIAQKPRPVGTEENARVRAYLAGQLRALGLETEVQSILITEARGDMVIGARLSNVLGRLKGTGGGRAVVLMAHYDTVATGPGAADGGAAVAALLEGLRAIQAAGPLKNDLIVAFTDAEEIGMLGAKAFVQQHPWAKTAGLVLNFHARGTAGPAFMLRTSPENGWLIRELAGAVPGARANSLTAELFRSIEDDTDFAVFAGSGVPTMEQAFIGNWPGYHTMEDTAQNLNPRSLQHMGTYVVGLARRFGNLDLTGATRAPDRVYFDLAGLLIHYPVSWALPLAVVALCGLAGALYYGHRRRIIETGPVLAGFGWGVLAIGAAALVISVWMGAVGEWFPGPVATFLDAPYDGGLQMWTAIALAVAATSGLFTWLRRWYTVPNLWAGGLVLWAVLAVAAAAFRPGVSHLLLWPLVAAALGLLLSMTPAGSERGRVHAAVLALPLAGLLVLLPQTSAVFGIAPLSYYSGAALGFAVLPVLLLAEHVESLSGGRWWLLPAVAVLSAAVLTGVSASRAGNFPANESMYYYANTTADKAHWVARGQGDWSRAVMGPKAGFTPAQFLHPTAFGYRIAAPAPFTKVAVPTVKVTGDRPDGTMRVVDLLVTPSARSHYTVLNFEPDSVVTAIWLEGQEVYRVGVGVISKHSLVLYNPQPAFRVTVRSASDRLVGVVHDTVLGWPDDIAATMPPRPSGSIPAPGLPDSTLLIVSFRY